MHWQKGYYVSPGISHPGEVRLRLRLSRAVSGIYLVTLSKHRDHILEIHPAYLAARNEKYIPCPAIIGMTAGKDEAMEMVRRLVEAAVQATGSPDVAAYLQRSHLTAAQVMAK